MRLKTENHDSRANEAENPEPQPDNKRGQSGETQLWYTNGGSLILFLEVYKE